MKTNDLLGGTDSRSTPEVHPRAVRYPFAALAPSSDTQRVAHAPVIRGVCVDFAANIFDRKRPVPDERRHGIFDNRILAPVSLAMLRLKVHEVAREIRPLALVVERQPFRP